MLCEKCLIQPPFQLTETGCLEILWTTSFLTGFLLLLMEYNFFFFLELQTSFNLTGQPCWQPGARLPSAGAEMAVKGLDPSPFDPWSAHVIPEQNQGSVK